MKAERVIAIVKDVALFITGLAGIVYQQVTGRVHELLLLVFTVMVGLPGFAALWTLLGGRGTTEPSSSSSPSGPQSTESSRS